MGIFAATTFTVCTPFSESIAISGADSNGDALGKLQLAGVLPGTIFLLRL
jgi:hypothetical protein